jgi:hypothetical protein
MFRRIYIASIIRVATEAGGNIQGELNGEMKLAEAHMILRLPKFC